MTPRADAIRGIVYGLLLVGVVYAFCWSIYAFHTIREVPTLRRELALARRDAWAAFTMANVANKRAVKLEQERGPLWLPPAKEVKQ